MQDLDTRISDNLKRINERISAAAERAGRKREDVLLTAVSKTVDCDAVRAAFKAGQRDFAENRVQKLMEKQEGLEDLAGQINWHLIGQLQTNKVKYCGDKVVLIHSIDRPELAEALDKFGKKHGIMVKGLLELNVSGEESKTGMPIGQIDEFLEKFQGLSNVSLEGIMTMAPFGASETELHKIFVKAREISVDIALKKVHNVNMLQLSMGMSGDFEVAVEEGATIVRVGTAIFA